MFAEVVSIVSFRIQWGKIVSSWMSEAGLVLLLKFKKFHIARDKLLNFSIILAPMNFPHGIQLVHSFLILAIVLDGSVHCY